MSATTQTEMKFGGSVDAVASAMAFMHQKLGASLMVVSTEGKSEVFFGSLYSYDAQRQHIILQDAYEFESLNGENKCPIERHEYFILAGKEITQVAQFDKDGNHVMISDEFIAQMRQTQTHSQTQLRSELESSIKAIAAYIGCWVSVTFGKKNGVQVGPLTFVDLNDKSIMLRMERPWKGYKRDTEYDKIYIKDIENLEISNGNASFNIGNVIFPLITNKDNKLDSNDSNTNTSTNTSTKTNTNENESEKLIDYSKHYVTPALTPLTPLSMACNGKSAPNIDLSNEEWPMTNSSTANGDGNNIIGNGDKSGNDKNMDSCLNYYLFDEL